jgi:hypothetical protein
MRRLDGVPAMSLLLGGLLVFSVWLPVPVLRLTKPLELLKESHDAVFAHSFLLGLLCLTTSSRTAWNGRTSSPLLQLPVWLSKWPATGQPWRGVSAPGFLRRRIERIGVGVDWIRIARLRGLCSGYFRKDENDGRVTHAQLRRYYVLTPLLVGAMLLVQLADNLGVMWVAIESTTLASVLLVTFYNQRTSFEAGWKYIIIGSVGISLALFGTVFTYYSAVGVLGPETHGGMNWSVLVGVADRLNPQAIDWRSFWSCWVTHQGRFGADAHVET